MSNSRSKNATLNIIVGWGSQIGILLLSFVSRRIFVQFLSADYLGINGLYGNILSVLALAELGLGNVTQFFLFKPVAEKDYYKINSLVKYFRKLYTIISFAVMGIGLLLIPLLQYIVNSELQQNELIIYYILFLFNSCVTYFSADKIALLAANQDTRLTKYVTLAVNFGVQIFHIVVLALWHNYTIYVTVTLISSLANVIITNRICYKRYPYLKDKKNKKVDIDKKYIADNLKSTFLYKIGATIVNNTDNILISVMISTAAVGLYSNYYMVVAGIQAFIVIITTSLISGIGNLSANGDRKRMNEIFNLMIFVYHFFAAFGGVSFFLLFNELIPIWLGEEYLLDPCTVFAIAFSFYLTNAISPIWMFRESNGMFGKVKYLLLTTAGANIIFSIILGKYFGIFGILIATSLARIVTQVWYEPYILFKNLFGTSARQYWINQTKNVVVSAICAVLCFGVTRLIPHTLLFLVIKCLVFLFIFAIAFGLIFRNSTEMFEIKGYIQHFIRRGKGKNDESIHK